LGAVQQALGDGVLGGPLVEPAQVFKHRTPTYTALGVGGGAGVVGGVVVGMGIVALELDGQTRYAVLEDVVVDGTQRGQGLGRWLLAKLMGLLRDMGVQSMFLESGVRNERAHSFFHVAGFTTVSVVMRKELRDVNQHAIGADMTADLKRTIDSLTLQLDSARIEVERLRAACEKVLSWSTKDTTKLLSNPPQNAALFNAHSVLRAALAHDDSDK